MLVDTLIPLQAYSRWSLTCCSFSNAQEGPISVAKTFLSSRAQVSGDFLLKIVGLKV